MMLLGFGLFPNHLPVCAAFFFTHREGVSQGMIPRGQNQILLGYSRLHIWFWMAPPLPRNVPVMRMCQVGPCASCPLTQEPSFCFSAFFRSILPCSCGSGMARDPGLLHTALTPWG